MSPPSSPREPALTPQLALHRALLARGETCGCAESVTGGELAGLLSQPVGASATFVGGVVSYATRVKRDLLGVTSAQVVSADCASQMATGVRARLGVDWALATTGVAGPDEQEGRPVGTVYLAVAGPLEVRTSRLLLEGDRAEIRSAACTAALALLLNVVSDG